MGHIYPTPGAGMIGMENGVWRDLQMFSRLRSIGANDPTLSVLLGGIRALKFAGNLMNELGGSGQFQHDYMEGSDIDFHVHWMHDSAVDNGSIVWGVELIWLNVHGILPVATATYKSDPIPVLGSEKGKSHATTIVELSGTGKKISSQLLFRLFRDPADPNDTYSAGAFLTDVDSHYQRDMAGSPSIWRKS